MGLPRTPDELTPQWLTERLREAGVLTGDQKIASLGHERLGEGAGFIGIVDRVSLSYDGAPGAISSLIAKFPSPEEGARTIGNMYGLYEREVRFYSDLAAKAGVATPRCYFASWDADAGQSLILLEDLAGTGTIGDQVAGCMLEHAELAIRNLAQFHARWCDPSKLAAITWLQDGTELVRGAMVQAYEPSVGPFLQIFGDRLDASVRAIVPGLNDRVITLMDGLAIEDRMTMAHGDYRLDNLFFGREGAPYKIAVIDWQSPNRAWGAYDIAYFVSGSFPVEQRRAYEPAMMRAYHETFVAGTKAKYSFEEFFDDYRRSLLVYLAIFVVNGATLEMTNERAVQLFEVIFDRLNAALVDLNAMELLPA